MNNYIKVYIKPKSINQLRKEHPDLFYDQHWYSEEKFATTKPKARTLYINPQLAESTNKTWNEQQELLGGGELVTANELIQCLITHYQATGERLLESSYSRTSDVISVGGRVSVGSFDADGLGVYSFWGDGRNSRLGLAASRSVEPSKVEPLDPLNIQIPEVVINGVVYVPKESQ